MTVLLQSADRAKGSSKLMMFSGTNIQVGTAKSATLLQGNLLIAAESYFRGMETCAIHFIRIYVV